MGSKASYGVVFPEQSLPTGRTVGLGLQHVIAMFGATVLAPVIMGFDPNLAVFFSGIGTLIFMLIVRGRVPSYLGSSFAFIGPVIAAKANGGVPAALGGIAAAAVVYFVVGLLARTAGGKRAIEVLMPPPVTAAVVAIIGIGLAPVAWGSASKDWGLAIFTFLVAFFVAVGTRGFTKLIPVLVAVIVGSAAAALTGRMDFTEVVKAPLFGLPNFVTPVFNPVAIGLIVPVVLMLVAENIGHVKAVGAYMDRDLTPEVGNTFMGDAVATFVSAMGGGTGQTTYAENIGVMSITKVFSRYPLMVAAVTAICLGLVPKFGALVLAIPVPVMGGITLLLFGMIAGASTKVISTASEDWGGIENFGVYGVSIALCAALVAVFNTNSAMNEALKTNLPTALDLGFAQLDAIGAGTFFAVGMNLLIVLIKKLSPWAEEQPVQKKEKSSEAQLAEV